VNISQKENTKESISLNSNNNINTNNSGNININSNTNEATIVNSNINNNLIMSNDASSKLTENPNINDNLNMSKDTSSKMTEIPNPNEIIDLTINNDSRVNQTINILNDITMIENKIKVSDTEPNKLIEKKEKASDDTKKSKTRNTEVLLEDTFSILGEEEKLDENNEWFCQKCKKKQKAIKKLEIYYAPKILIIQIKRFNHTQKVNTKVKFPIKDLDLTNYILSKEGKQPIKYDLFAVANHFGSLSFGHYTAFCKNSVKNKWYEYNDSVVTEIDDESKIMTPNAYILFYRQKGLSQLNWKKIYHKKFVDIKINEYDSLVNFNEDYLKNNTNNADIDNDINEFDKLIKEKYITKKLQNKRNNNKANGVVNDINNLNQLNEYKFERPKEVDDFLAKKRINPDL